MTTTPEFDHVLASIAARAATLRERLAAAPPAAVDEAAARARLSRWAAALGPAGDLALVRRRLAWQGVDPDRALAILGGAASAVAPLPAWCETLTAIVGWVREATPAAEVDDFVHAHEPLPFEALLAPIVRGARRAAGARSPAPRVAWSVAARAAMDRALLERLAHVAARTLAHELAQARGAGARLLGAFDAPGAGSSREVHDAFVQAQRAEGMLATFARYPLLARLVALVVEQWIEATCELVERLDADAAAIARAFGGAPIEEVVAVRPALSDPHHGGRRVVALELSGGLGVVYKPKDLALEAAYARLVAWCNASGATPELCAPRVLCRGAYGWVERVRHAPCATRAEVERFYERAGAHLALVYALGGTDCHAENLIAAGEHPVLVDLETLLHPEGAPIDEDGGAFDSVLRTGLLPRWECREDTRHVVDQSGLGAFGEHRARVRVWKHVGTDDVHAAWETSVLPMPENVPSRGGAQEPADAHLAAIAAGFARTYRALAGARDELLAEGGALARFAGRAVRFLFRATKVYARVLDAALAPAALADGVDFGLALEQLAYAYMGARERPPAWPILDAEVRALERLDVPRFVADSSAREPALDDGEGPVAFAYVRGSGFERMTERLARMGEADLRAQLEMIGATTFTRLAAPHGTAVAIEARDEGSPPLAPDPLALVVEARRIGDLLRARVVRLAEDRATWLGLTYVRNTERFQVNLLSASLYDGVAGVALFLATLAAETDDQGARALAELALAPLRRSLRTRADGADRLVRRMGIGGALGAGSVIYALARAARELGDPSWLEDAAIAARGITLETIAAAAPLDVMEGVAGLALGVTALLAQVPSAALVDIARACGDRLVAEQIAGGPFAGGWRARAEEESPEPGFSHGAAGIAYALARVHAVVGDERYARAARRGLAFDAATRPRQPMVSWCHGPAGSALAHFGAAQALGERPDDAAAGALEATLAYGLRGFDTLCCGAAGRIDAVLVAADALGRADLVVEARRRAAALVARASGAHGYRSKATTPGGGALWSPALFQGLAGIGHVLLRAARPERVRSVLVWR